MPTSHLMLASMLWGLKKEMGHRLDRKSKPGPHAEMTLLTPSPTAPKSQQDTYLWGATGDYSIHLRWRMRLQRVVPSSACQLSLRHPPEDKAHYYGGSWVIC